MALPTEALPMKALTWIPFALVAGFLAGFGVQLSADILPLLAVALFALGYYLIAVGRMTER
jgi:uncharacterized membrane protein